MVNLIKRIIKIEAGPCSSRNAEFLMQRHSAMVTRPDGNPVLIENLGDIVGMYTSQCKGGHCTFRLSFGAKNP